MNARNTIPNPKTKPIFIDVNVHHRITEDRVKKELLNNNEPKFQELKVEQPANQQN